MPSNWLYIDSNFPTFTGEENLKEQVTTIQNYMYMLVEQLRYTLHNLDLSNMNEAAVDDWENAITEPIYIHLEDSDERITQLAITAAEAETFAAEERKLVEKFAAKDEDGNIRVAQGRFTFRAPGERGEYEEQHRQLAETPAEIRFTKLRAPAPDTISVKSLEVLSRFIDFRGGDRK